MRGSQCAGVRGHAVEFGVVVIGIVVKEKKLFDAGFHGDGEGVVHAAVSPPDVLVVFVAIVLRVENQHVGAAQELDRFLFLGPREFQRGPAFGGDGGREALMAAMRLIVREKRQRTLVGGQAVADTNAGMIGEPRPHADLADIKTHILEFFDFDAAGQFAEGHRKIRAFHLAGQHIHQSLARAFKTQDAQMTLRFVNRHEKRQALNMIPVGV